MYSGNVTAVRTVLAILTGMSILVGAGAALAQTPDEACAADSLYLVSPPAIAMKQQVVGRPGLVLSWEDLDTSDATCYTLTGLEALGFTVDVEGGFGDSVDRLISFTSQNNGSVGHVASNSLVLSWQSQGNAANGVLAGNINLANNGGILRWDSGTNTWEQANTGLPMTWLKTNIVALDEGSGGFMVAGITAGETLGSNPVGVWVYRSGVWGQVGEDVFRGNIVITKVKVSPLNNDHFAVGTVRNGLFVTSDGGVTFTQWTTQLDPDYPSMPSNFRVGAMEWSESRLIAFLPLYGLFVSENNGTSFTRSVIQVEENLDADPVVFSQPTAINEIVVDPSDDDHILLALNFNGVWESTDGAATWHDLYGDLNVPSGDPENLGAWSHSALSVAIDSGDNQVMVVALKQEGLWQTSDGGTTWVEVAADLQPDNINQLSRAYVVSNPDVGGEFYVLEDQLSLLVSTDGGVNWTEAAEQPQISRGLDVLMAKDGSGDLIIPSWGGGIYVPGTPLVLSDTYNTTTSSNLRELELGLDITFGSGTILQNDTFNLVCQTFQGWTVWRSPSHDRFNMTLLGMYDRVNPESCIEGYCGDEGYEIVPQCYVSKRAACFNFDTPDTVRFFDDEVYNGFSYYYSVATFDYGNTALVSPQNNTNSMVFSPRFADDPNTPFAGMGNIQFIQINSNIADVTTGETIYVYPNPLRRDAGVPGSEGETVVFTNLPPNSHLRVFTTAGDDVMDLGPETMQLGNIYWDTRNRDGEPIAPAVYLYKVEAPGREDHWGKLVVIR